MLARALYFIKPRLPLSHARFNLNTFSGETDKFMPLRKAQFRYCRIIKETHVFSRIHKLPKAFGIWPRRFVQARQEWSGLLFSCAALETITEHATSILSFFALILKIHMLRVPLEQINLIFFFTFLCRLFLLFLNVAISTGDIIRNGKFLCEVGSSTSPTWPRRKEEPGFTKRKKRKVKDVTVCDCCSSILFRFGLN